MLLKLITLLVLVHQLSACCLPDTYQMTILSETRWSGMGRPYRARIVMAASAARGKAAIITHAQSGHESAIYIDLSTRRAYSNYPPYGCSSYELGDYLLQQLNQSRCVPDEMRAGATVIPIVLPGGVRARLFSAEMPLPGHHGNGSVDALLTERCRPVMVKLSGEGFDSTNVFGDLKDRPEDDLFELPAACRNATHVSYGGSASSTAAPPSGAGEPTTAPFTAGRNGTSRKRHPMHLPYVSRSLFYV